MTKPRRKNYCFDPGCRIGPFSKVSLMLSGLKRLFFMNSRCTEGDVVCRMYVRRTLTSETLSHTLEEAKLALRDADLLHICKGAGEWLEFSSLPLTSRLKQQNIYLDGVVLILKCRGSVPREGAPCISFKYLRKALLTRRSEFKRKSLQVTPAKKLRLLSQKNRRARARIENQQVHHCHALKIYC
ncbi:hypothetical protein MRX96_013497 [Rhipicephalus microplus]